MKNLDKTCDQIPYSQWMKLIDTELGDRIGLGMDFLPDWLSRDAYDAGASVREGFIECLQQADFGTLADIEALFDEGEFVIDEA